MKANLDSRLSKLESATPRAACSIYGIQETKEGLEALYRNHSIGAGDTVILARWLKEPTVND